MLVHQDSRHLLLTTAEDPRQYTYLRNLGKSIPGKQQCRRSGKKERQDETQFITKIDGFSEFSEC
jgi:hypothetical protein